MKQELSGILLLVVWRNIASQYFNKSSYWLYHKLDGVKTNGTNKSDEFSSEELRLLKGALCDLSDRIRRVSESL